MPELPAMNVLALVATAVLGLLVLLWTWLRWSRGGGARVLLRGLGTLLAFAGLYLSGLAVLAGNGIRSIVEWARSTAMTALMTVGFSLLGVGLVLFVVGSLLRPRNREQARGARPVRSAGPAPAVSSGPGTPAPAPRGRKAAAPDDGLTDEDREIAALLDKRGIR